jgi:nucleoid-associated protein YgaU
MTTAKEFLVEIKKHRFEALMIVVFAAVLVAVPVVADASQDPAEEPPSLSEETQSGAPVEEAADPELDAPTLRSPTVPEVDAVSPPAAPESNVDEPDPAVIVEGEPEADDPACCEPDESEEIRAESELDAGGSSADRVRTSRKSRASVRGDAGSSKNSGVATRSNASAGKNSGSATTKSSEAQSTRSSGTSSGQSSGTKKVVSAPSSDSRVAGSRVAPAPGRAYVVRRGDCLWLITQAALGNRVSIVRINGGWQRIWRANASTIGGNPHLIFPGQVLRIPREL